MRNIGLFSITKLRIEFLFSAIIYQTIQIDFFYTIQINLRISYNLTRD